MYQINKFKCKIPSIALAHGIGSSPRAGHEHKCNRRTASARSTDILQSTLAPSKRHTNTFQEDILYLKCTVAGNTLQVFFNFMSVAKLYRLINCHHLLLIGIDSQFHWLVITRYIKTCGKRHISWALWIFYGRNHLLNSIFR